jgi:hypothetical protein
VTTTADRPEFWMFGEGVVPSRKLEREHRIEAKARAICRSLGYQWEALLSARDKWRGEPRYASPSVPFREDFMLAAVAVEAVDGERRD